MLKAYTLNVYSVVLSVIVIVLAINH